MTTIIRGLVPLKGCILGMREPRPKSKKISVLTVDVVNSTAVTPAVLIPTIALMFLPCPQNGLVYSGVTPLNAYPYLLMWSRWSTPVSSTKTNISGSNSVHCALNAPRREYERCNAIYRIFFRVIP